MDAFSRKTKLQIISRLWSHIYDLLAYILHGEDGEDSKTFDEIQQEIDLTEYYCRPYCDCDDDELYAADVVRAAKAILEEKEGRRKEWIS